MAISRFFSSVADKFQKGPFYSEESNLPSGGRSGYHPEAQQRVRRSRITGTQAQRTAAQSPVFRGSGNAQFGQPGYTGYSVGYQAAAPVNPAQSGIYQQPAAPQQSLAYQQPAAPQQSFAYQQPAVPQQSFAYQQPAAPQQNAGYRQPAAQPQVSAYRQPQAAAYQQPNTAAQSAAFQQPMAVGQSFPLQGSGYRTPQQGPVASYRRQQPAGNSIQIPGMQRPVTFQAANSQSPMIYQRPGFSASAPSEPQAPVQTQPELGYSGGVAPQEQPTQPSVVIPVTPSGYQGNEQPNRGKAVKNRYAAPAPSRYRKEAGSEGFQQNFAPKADQPYQSKFQTGGETGFGVKQRNEAQGRRFGGKAPAQQPQSAPQPVQPMQPMQPVQAMQPVQPLQPAQPAAEPDNLSYMPNVFVGNDGTAYRHVERLTQPMSASTCYRLIEFMRNGESVIVNTELIQDERENQRCLDLLYGAAYTMNCTFTRIAARSIYLIAPATVTVIAYESIRQMNEQDAAVRWPGAESAILSGKRAKRAPVFGNYRAVE